MSENAVPIPRSNGTDDHLLECLSLSCFISIPRRSHIGREKADDDQNTRSERDKSMIDITELPNHSE